MHIVLSRNCLTRRYFSPEIQALWYRRPSLRALRRGLRTAEWCSLALAFTTCRKIILRSSAPPSKSGKSTWELVPAQNTRWHHSHFLWCVDQRLHFSCPRIDNNLPKRKE